MSARPLLRPRGDREIDRAFRGDVRLAAERELRLDDWRVFYTIMNDGELVLINLIGEKRGDKLFIGGEEFEL